MIVPVSPTVPDLGHRRRRLRGRDPLEPHRTATPLELLYDLVFVVAFGQAANELAHYVAEGHVRTGIFGFGFAAFAIAWAWISYSWFASAYDEDDWVCRLATMVQMVGTNHRLWRIRSVHSATRIGQPPSVAVASGSAESLGTRVGDGAGSVVVLPARSAIFRCALLIAVRTRK